LGVRDPQLIGYNYGRWFLQEAVNLYNGTLRLMTLTAPTQLAMRQDATTASAILAQSPAPVVAPSQGASGQRQTWASPLPNCPADRTTINYDDLPCTPRYYPSPRR
jgi:hypothetical protein